MLQLVLQLICRVHGGDSQGRFRFDVGCCALGCGCYHDNPLNTLQQIRAQPYGEITHDPNRGYYGHTHIAWQHEAMKWSEVLYYFDLLEWQIQRAERIANSTIISKITPG